MKKVKIIIPVYNGLEYLKQTVVSLISNTDTNLYDLILVDNGSDRDTKKYLKGLVSTRPNIELLTSSKNLGFAGGNNLALDLINKQKDWEYVCFLNSDVVLPKKWLSHLLEVFRSDRVGIVGPVSNAAGGWQGRKGEYRKLEEYFSFADTTYETYKNRHDRYSTVAHIVGLCMLVSRKCCKKVIKFDELFIKGNWEDSLTGDRCIPVLEDNLVDVIPLEDLFERYKKDIIYREDGKEEIRLKEIKTISLEKVDEYSNKWLSQKQLEARKLLDQGLDEETIAKRLNISKSSVADRLRPYKKAKNSGISNRYTTSTWANIKKIVRHKTDKDMYRVSYKLGETICTNDHSLVVVENNKLVEKKPLELGDTPLLKVDQIDKTQDLKEIDLLKYVAKHPLFCRLSYNNTHFWLESKHSKRSIKVRRLLKVQSEEFKSFCRLLGAYIAEGSNGLGVCSSNLTWLEELKRDYKIVFKKAASIGKIGKKGSLTFDRRRDKYYKSNDDVYVLRFLGGMSVSSLFSTLCGSTSKDKRLPSFIFSVDREYQKILYLKMLEGDGHFSGRKELKNHLKGWCYYSKSLTLISGVSFLLTQQQQRHTIHYWSESDTYSLKTVTRYGSVLNKSKVVKYNYKGYVYDLEVDNKTHTFVDACGQIVVHNTDMCLRARLGGYDIYIDQSVFIHHYFNKSFQKNALDSRKLFLENKKRFYDKWNQLNDETPQKLVGMCRVKNGVPYIEKTLEEVSKFCDEIVVLVDQHTTDNTEEVCKKFPKVVDLQREKPHEYNEAYSRNYVFNMAKRRNPTWIWAIDHDEYPEPKMIRMKDQLMRPYDPQIMCWTFPVVQHWKNERLYRKDGLWGGFRQGRMFRYLPDQQIGGNSDDLIHSGSTPSFPLGSVGHSSIRIRHFGNIDKDYRHKKYLWYTKIDANKNLDMILGANVVKDYYWRLYYGKPSPENIDKDSITWKVIKKDWKEFNKDYQEQKPKYGEFFDEDCYRHIVDEKGLVLEEYTDGTGITLCMIAKNEEGYIGQAINSVTSIVDDIVVVDTGSTDDTKNIARSLGAKVIELDWDVYDTSKGFSFPRNLSIKEAKTPWILRIDPDEYITPGVLPKILELIKKPVDGYIFPIQNYLEDPKTNKNAKWVLSETCRLFRNLPGLEYKNLVHEELDDSWLKIAKERKEKGKPDLLIKKIEYPIQHFGYLRGLDFVNTKFKKYCGLGDRQIDMMPNDPRAYFNTAVHHYHIGDYKEALKRYKKVIELDPTHWMALSDIASLFFNFGNYLKAKQYANLALKHLRKHDHPIQKDKLLNNLKIINVKLLENLVF